MTDRDQLEGLLSTLGDLTTTSEQWDTLLGKSQNVAPDGAGDGTIDEPAWRQMRALCNALHNIIGAQGALNRERIAAAALAKLSPTERDALGLS